MVIDAGFVTGAWEPGKLFASPSNLNAEERELKLESQGQRIASVIKCFFRWGKHQTEAVRANPEREELSFCGILAALLEKRVQQGVGPEIKPKFWRCCLATHGASRMRGHRAGWEALISKKTQYFGETPAADPACKLSAAFSSCIAESKATASP